MIQASKRLVSPDPRFSIQHGWSRPAGAIVAHEAVLGLAWQGGHQNRLVTGNKMQTVQTLGWFNTHRSPPYVNNEGETYAEQYGIPAHALVYDTATETFPQAAEAAAWIAAHAPGHVYIIGNEPNLEHVGEYLTAAEQATFHFTSANLIRANDPTAFIVTAGWAGGISSGGKVDTEQDFLLAHYKAYGVLDADALGLHNYQKNAPNNSAWIDKLNIFLNYANKWKSQGLTRNNKIYISELGWYGGPGGAGGADMSTPANCIAFLDWAIPQLKANPQIIRWHWWEWVHPGTDLTEVKDGITVPTALGAHYAEMAHNS